MIPPARSPPSRIRPSRTSRLQRDVQVCVESTFASPWSPSSQRCLYARRGERFHVVISRPIDAKQLHPHQRLIRRRRTTPLRPHFLSPARPFPPPLALTNPTTPPPHTPNPRPP